MTGSRSWGSPRNVAQIGALLALAVGSLVLLGWALDVRVLKSIGPSFITMKANTAFGLMALAAALLAARAQWRRTSLAFAIFTAVLATVTLLEYLLGWNAGIDELVFRDLDGAGGRFPPGRLAPITAVNFLLLSTSVVAASVPGSRPARVSQVAALVALVLAFQAVLGYAFGVTYTFGSAFYTQIALHTALGLVALCTGMLALRAHEGLMAIFLAPTLGGVVGRRLILSAVLVPPLVNWLQMLAQRAGLFDADFGVLARVVGNVVFFAIIVWRTATALHRSDMARLDTEAALRNLNAELERRVDERTQELLRANRELDSFSYSVSHDLRSPLRSIDGFSAALEEDAGPSLDDPSKHHLARIRHAAQRMGELIEGLLDLARLGQQAIQVRQVDVSALARETLEELARQSSDRRVEVVVSPGLSARADPRLLRVVFENLLRNAWKFTSRTPQARIEVGCTEQGAFFVKDNGAGFDMKFADRLFGVFQRLHSDADFPGTGVGLATVQRIVHRHGGKTWTESAPGRGATFFFTLGAGPRPEESMSEPQVDSRPSGSSLH